MGKWCEVKCGCPKRKIAPNNDLDKCGHRQGVLLQFWPGDILKISRTLEAVYKHKEGSWFEVFRRIARGAKFRGQLYDQLIFAGEDVALWQLEIEQLQAFLAGSEFMGWHEQQHFEQELKAQTLLYGDVHKTLNDGLDLCQASLLTGNPIEFYL